MDMDFYIILIIHDYMNLLSKKFDMSGLKERIVDIFHLATSWCRGGGGNDSAASRCTMEHTLWLFQWSILICKETQTKSTKTLLPKR